MQRQAGLDPQLRPTAVTVCHKNKIKSDLGKVCTAGAAPGSGGRGRGSFPVGARGDGAATGGSGGGGSPKCHHGAGDRKSLFFLFSRFLKQSQKRTLKAFLDFVSV